MFVDFLSSPNIINGRPTHFTRVGQTSFAPALVSIRLSFRKWEADHHGPTFSFGWDTISFPPGFHDFEFAARSDRSIEHVSESTYQQSHCASILDGRSARASKNFQPHPQFQTIVRAAPSFLTVSLPQAIIGHRESGRVRSASETTCLCTRLHTLN